MAELLPRIDVGDVHLDEGEIGRRQGVAQGQAVVSEGAGVDQGPVGPVGLLLQEVDDLALAVGLEGADLRSQLGGAPAHPVFDLGQGDGAVHLGLPLAEGV